MKAARGTLEPYIKDEIEYYDYQVEGIRHLARLPSFLLADDMGLGKSLQALTVFGIDLYMGLSETLLIVCPATLKLNWSEEIDKFTRIPHTVLGVKAHKKTGDPVDCTPAERKVQLEEFAKMKGPRALVVNYEQLLPHLAEIRKMNFDVAIYDEAHAIKNGRSKRSQAALEIQTRRSFMLTGTPMPNRVDELWPLLNKILPHRFPHYFSFRQRYCVMGGYQGKVVVGTQNEAELTTILHSIMLRRMKSDVLVGREEPIMIRRVVGMTPKQRKAYDSLFDELVLEMPGEGGEMEPQEIENGMTKFMRLKQICATLAEVHGPEHDESAKLDLMITDAVGLVNNGEKIIVFTTMRESLAAYVRRAQAAMPGIPIWEITGDNPIPSRQGIVRDWGAHEGPSILICMLQVAGVGLNMVQGRTIQFIDKLFVPGLNKQAIDRADRIGQQSTVTVYDYLVKDSVEDRVDKILREKEVVIGTIVEGENMSMGSKRALVEAVMGSYTK